jgi:hypothetical protein
MARILHQDAQVRKDFEAAIRKKTQQQIDQVVMRAQPRIPSVLQPLLTPLVRWSARSRQAGFEHTGSRGEGQLALALRMRLGGAWTLCPNVVLSLGPQAFAQLDHLIIGPAGLYVIEVKTWQSAIRARGDAWQRKSGTGWVAVSSPTKQNAEHVEKLRHWIVQTQFGSLQTSVMGAVVVLDSPWLRVTNSSMPVFDRPSALARWLVETDKQRPILPPNKADQLVQRLRIG